MAIETRKKWNLKDDFKQDAVKRVTEPGYKVSEATWNSGIRDYLQRRLRREFEAGGKAFLK